MGLKHIIIAVVVICAVLLGTLMMIGPKMGLQTPPIEPKAMAYLMEHKLLKDDEQLTGYKAISYYTYNEGLVITTNRLFVYNNNQVHTIPLDKISLVSIKDTELGHQEVFVSAGQNGAVAIEVYHTSVPKLIELLNVPESIIKHHEKHPVVEGKPAPTNPAAELVEDVKSL